MKIIVKCIQRHDKIIKGILMEDFDKWFMKIWEKEEGIISPVTASRLLKVSRQRVTKMMNDGELKSYKYNSADIKVSFIPISEVEKKRK